jgi:hypothetical protein
MLKEKAQDSETMPIGVRCSLGQLERKEEPYRTIAVLLEHEMEKAYEERKNLCQGKLNGVPYLYITSISLSEKFREQLPRSKLTDLKVCYIMQAVLLGSGLKEDRDFIKRKSHKGRINYGIALNSKTISAVKDFAAP